MWSVVSQTNINILSSAIATLWCMHSATAYLLLWRIHFLRSTTNAA